MSKRDKMESDMNILMDDDAFLKSLENDASIQRNSHYFSFRDTQFRSDSESTPQKLPSAPHPSPVLSPEQSVVARLSDQFESELLKACNTFCDSTDPHDAAEDGENPSPSTTQNRNGEFSLEELMTTFCDLSASNNATVSPSTRSKRRLLESILNESTSKSTFLDYTNVRDDAEDIGTAWASSCPITIQLENSTVESDVENNLKREIECRSPTRLESSLSNISLNTWSSSPFSDRASIIAHRESEVSDISLSESEILLSRENTLDLVKLERRNEYCWDEFEKSHGKENRDKSCEKENCDKMDTEIPIDCWKVNSPRKPRSSVGEFLNWRKNKALRRKRRSSVDNAFAPEPKREKDDSDSKFLMTI